MRKVHLLPNLLTLGNAFCGLLAMAKAVDALAFPEDFHSKMESACAFIFAGMLLDGLDGLVARVTHSESDFGAQLDSFSDAVSFAVAPAILVKVLLGQTQFEGLAANPRVHFFAAASFALLAILRLVRFNLETDEEREAARAAAASHGGRVFSGLPSPVAAGAVAASVWMYLILVHPQLEQAEGTPTPMARLMGGLPLADWMPFLENVPLLLLLLMPGLGLLMVSHVPYAHLGSWISQQRPYPALITFVFGLLLFYLAPVPYLFCVFNGFVFYGLLRHLAARSRTPAGIGIDGSVDASRTDGGPPAE